MLAPNERIVVFRSTEMHVSESCDFIVVGFPETLKEKSIEYHKWMSRLPYNEKFPTYRIGQKSFMDWLLDNGARVADETDLEIYDT